MGLAAELRQATDHLRLTINRFATIGSNWLDVAFRQLKQQDFAGMVRLYEEHSEVSYGLDQPFLWTINVEVGGTTVAYGELFRRLAGLLDELAMRD